MKIISSCKYLGAALTGALIFACVGSSQAQPYYLAGAFNGWNASGNQMTSGPSAGEYSYTITGETANTYDQCKVTDGTFNNTWPGNNLTFLYDNNGTATIHFWPGVNQDGWIPSSNRVGYDDPTNDPGWGLPGTFDNWDGTQVVLQAQGNGVYSNSFAVPTAGTINFKLQSPPGNWNDINFGSPDFGNGDGNGSFITTTSPQTLPVVLDLPNGRYYVGAPTLPPTNYVTFQLDMSEQVAFGNFTNTDENTNDVDFGQPVNTIAAGGSFDNWSTADQLTNYTVLYPNDPNPGLKTNLYIGTFAVQGYLPVTINWKYRVDNLDGSYEQPVSTSGGNRVTVITNQNMVLPVTYYDDLGLGDLVLSNTTVMFSLYITNGTLSTSTNSDGSNYAFEKGSDSIYVNGPWANWDWGISIPGNQQMVEVGDSDLYTNSYVFPRGSSVYVTYKYGLDGIDDENGSNTNHIREIRSYGPTYSFPQDVWSYTILGPGSPTPYPLAGLGPTNIVEPDFGYLAIGALSGGNLPITWLGRPAVLLQSSPDLINWTTLGATDATETNSWPYTGGAQYFRLIKQ
jgi:hypothetical protein